jgi:hypothetical protein
VTPGDPIRLTIEATSLPGRSCGPYVDIEVGVQVRKEVEDLVPGDAAGATWAVDVRHLDGDWRGPAVHGPRGERFLYLVWRGRQGPGAPIAMFRRAKLRLDAVPTEVAAEAARTGALVGRLGLTDARGMPLCASVKPPGIRWSA